MLHLQPLLIRPPFSEWRSQLTRDAKAPDLDNPIVPLTIIEKPTPHELLDLPKLVSPHNIDCIAVAVSLAGCSASVFFRVNHPQPNIAVKSPQSDLFLLNKVVFQLSSLVRQHTSRDHVSASSPAADDPHSEAVSIVELPRSDDAIQDRKVVMMRVFKDFFGGSNEYDLSITRLSLTGIDLATARRLSPKGGLRPDKRCYETKRDHGEIS